MIKFFKIIVMVGASVLNCITIYFLLALFRESEEEIREIITGITIALIIITIMALITVLILRKILPSDNIDKYLHKYIWWLDKLSFIIFIVYFICFAIQTRDLERGTELYMSMMFPGIIPLVSGTLSGILLKQ